MSSLAEPDPLPDRYAGWATDSMPVASCPDPSPSSDQVKGLAPPDKRL